MGVQGVAEYVAAGFEAAGILVLVCGFIFCTTRTIIHRQSIDEYRRGLGRTILLALELLVAADIVETVSTGLKLERVAALGLIVVVRTLLSFALEVEINGTLPWRRSEVPTSAR